MASTNQKPSVTIERSEKKKVIIENPNEAASRGSSVPAIVVDERDRSTLITERPPEWFLPILIEVDDQSQTKEHMHKIPALLRSIEKHKGCFDPMVVSIGPYHHGKKELTEVEKLKPSIAKEFIGKDTEKLDWFVEVARNARAWYHDDEIPLTAGSSDNWDDDQFTRMMFLDGCFILHIICCMFDNKINSMKLKPYQIAFVSSDLFLLENQLPFLVLEALMSFKDDVSDWQVRIQEFVTNQINPGTTKTLKEKDEGPSNKNDRHAHLLDLLHKTISGVGRDGYLPPNSGGELIHHTFRSVIELKAAGIKFTQSHGRDLKDVNFELHWNQGNVSLPHLTIDDLTKSRILNLVAYEACPDGPSDSLVTSYICFLDALIDCAEDVKELRSKHILHNLLGSDQAVAELFNELATHLVASPDSEYSIVMNSIEKYYKMKWFRWAREIWSTHFRSPWTTFAFFVAAAIILQTFLQTYFAAFPLKGDEEARRTPSRKIHYS